MGYAPEGAEFSTQSPFMGQRRNYEEQLQLDTLADGQTVAGAGTLPAEAQATVLALKEIEQHEAFTPLLEKVSRIPSDIRY